MATITITIPDAAIPRIQAALEYVFPEITPPAALSDLQDYIVADLKQFVQSAERREAKETAGNAIDVIDFS